LVAIVLDHRIGEQPLAHFTYGAFRRGAVGLGEVDLDVLALAHIADPGEAEIAERMRDRLALRIEHARLQGDVDLRLHAVPRIALAPSYCSVLGPLRSCGPPSGRMPSRRATSR